MENTQANSFFPWFLLSRASFRLAFNEESDGLQAESFNLESFEIQNKGQTSLNEGAKFQPGNKRRSQTKGTKLSEKVEFEKILPFSNLNPFNTGGEKSNSKKRNILRFLFTIALGSSLEKSPHGEIKRGENKRKKDSENFSETDKEVQTLTLNRKHNSLNSILNFGLGQKFQFFFFFTLFGSLVFFLQSTSGYRFSRFFSQKISFFNQAWPQFSFKQNTIQDEFRLERSVLKRTKVAEPIFDLNPQFSYRSQFDHSLTNRLCDGLWKIACICLIAHIIESTQGSQRFLNPKDSTVELRILPGGFRGKIIHQFRASKALAQKFFQHGVGLGIFGTLDLQRQVLLASFSKGQREKGTKLHLDSIGREQRLPKKAQRIFEYFQTRIQPRSESYAFGHLDLSKAGTKLVELNLKDERVKDQSQEVFNQTSMRVKAGVKGVQEKESFPRTFQTSKLVGIPTSPSAFLFVGPPGSGKTRLAYELSFASDKTLFICASSSIQKQIQIGTRIGAKRIQKLFQRVQSYATQNGPCILFLDEIDSIGRSRSSASSFPSSKIEDLEPTNTFIQESNEESFIKEGLPFGLGPQRAKLMEMQKRSLALNQAPPWKKENFNLKLRSGDIGFRQSNLEKQRSSIKASDFKASTHLGPRSKSGSSGATDVKLITEFLIQMDNRLRPSQRGGFFIIGTTNSLYALDSALTRSGRFDRILNLNYPKSQLRYNQLSTVFSELNSFLSPPSQLAAFPNDLKKLSSSELTKESQAQRDSSSMPIPWKFLVLQTANYSPADLTRLIHESFLWKINRSSIHSTWLKAQKTKTKIEKDFKTEALSHPSRLFEERDIASLLHGLSRLQKHKTWFQ